MRQDTSFQNTMIFYAALERIALLSAGARNEIFDRKAHADLLTTMDRNGTIEQVMQIIIDKEGASPAYVMQRIYRATYASDKRVS